MPKRLFQKTFTFCSIVRWLNFRCFALSLGIVSLTSLALVFYGGFNLRTSNTKVTKLRNQMLVNVPKNRAAYDPATCKLPVLDPFHPSVVNFIKDLGKLSCVGVSYSSFEDNVLRVEGEGIVSAQYRKIERPEGNDFRVVLSDPVKVPNKSGSRASTTDQKGEIFELLLEINMFVTSKVPRCTELNSSTKITRNNIFKFMLREKCLLEIRWIFPIPGRLVYLRSCPAVSSSADNYLQFSGFILSRFKS